jgi:hypothetical protein
MMWPESNTLQQLSGARETPWCNGHPITNDIDCEAMMAGKKHPVLIHVDIDEWNEFKRLCGRRRVSLKIRKLVSDEIKRTKITARTN